MIKVLYGGYLRPFKHVGHHPQFEHIRYPPPGYEFVTGGHFGLRTPARLLKSISALSWNAVANGSTLVGLTKFVHSRSLRAQLSVPSDVSLAFLPSMPFILGQIPWVIEIEDTTTLFAPFPRISGKRHDPRLFGTGGIYDSGFFPTVKALLQSESCRGIICHVKSTANSIPILFNDSTLSSKVTHIPLGIRQRFKRKIPAENDAVTILFTNSWHQASTGFYLRGGLDVLEAYSVIFSKHAHLRLILRSKLPQDLNQRYRQIIERCNVQVIDQFLSEDEMEALFSSADIYVLPSARLHVVSILQAMAAGLAIVVTDGWGMAEYIDHGRNGLIVPGRYGTCSWMDSNGILREYYKPVFSADPAVTNGLVEVLSSLIKDAGMRRNLGDAGLRDIETRFSIERWNRDLAKAFDKALSRDSN
jgi:glycosyltransferase involved in cell wall biosynthesis